jgi:hypothetical protein
VLALASAATADDYSLVSQVGDDYFGNEYPVSAQTATSSLPRVSVSFDVLILARVDGLEGDYFFDANSFDYFDPSTYQPLAGLDNITGDAKPGFRFNLVNYNADGSSTELSAFQMEKFGEPYTVQSDSPITYVFHFTVPANPQNSYDLDYSSRFRGIELNHKKPLGSRLTGIAGLRYVELSESFNINSGQGANTSKIDNEMYGVQLGGEFKMFNLGLIEFGATVKGGVYLNHAHVAAATVRASSNQAARFVDNEDELAFVGETLIGAFIPMGPQANLRIGYQMFYLDGVGLAPNQSDNYFLFAQAGAMDDQDVWFHGGYVGLEMFW